MKVRYVLPLTALVVLTKSPINLTNLDNLEYRVGLDNLEYRVGGVAYAQQEHATVVDYDDLGRKAEKLGYNNYNLIIEMLKPYEDEPNNTSSLFFNELGIAYSQNGDLKLAEKFFKKSAKLKPLSPYPRVNLGILYLRKMGEREKAKEQFEFVVKNIDKENKPANFYLNSMKSGRF